MYLLLYRVTGVDFIAHLISVLSRDFGVQLRTCARIEWMYVLGGRSNVPVCCVPNFLTMKILVGLIWCGMGWPMERGDGEFSR